MSPSCQTCPTMSDTTMTFGHPRLAHNYSDNPMASRHPVSSTDVAGCPWCPSQDPEIEGVVTVFVNRLNPVILSWFHPITVLLWTSPVTYELICKQLQTWLKAQEVVMQRSLIVHSAFWHRKDSSTMKDGYLKRPAREMLRSSWTMSL